MERKKTEHMAVNENVVMESRHYHQDGELGEEVGNRLQAGRRTGR